MATRQLSVKFDTEGFSQAINQLQQTGKAFDTVLKNSQEAIKRAKEAQSKALSSGDIQGATAAQKQLEQAAKASSRAIAASYKELGIKSSDSINQLRAQAVSAFEAIKNSGTASARDIATAQAALAAKLKQLDSQLNTTEGNYSKLSNTIKAVVAASALAAAATAKSSLEEFVSFDDAMRAFAVITQSTAEQVAQVREEVERLGIATSKSPQEIAQMSVELARAGFTASETKSALEGIIRASEATGEDLALVGDIIGKTLRQFSLPAEKSGYVADLLVQTANASNTSISGLGESLKYVGTTAATSNQSLEDTLLVLGLVGDAGLQGGQGGRNFSSALEKLKLASAGANDELIVTAKGMKTAGEAVEALGVSIRGADGKLRPFTDLLPEIREKLKGLSEQDKDVVFKVLFGTEGGRAINAALQANIDRIDTLKEKIGNASGVAVKSGEQMNAGLGGSLRLLDGSVKTLQIRISEEFAPAVKSGIDTVIGVVNGLIKESNTAIAVLSGFTMAGIARLVIAGIQALSAAIATMILQMQAAGGASAFFKTSIAALLTPTNLAVAAIGILAGTLIKFSLDAQQARADALALGQSLDVLATKKERTALVDLDDAERNSRKQLKEMEERSKAITLELAARSQFGVSNPRLPWEANRDLSIKSMEELRQESKRLDAEIQDLQTSLKRIPEVRKQIQDNLSGKNKTPSGSATRQPTVGAPLPPPTPDKTKVPSVPRAASTRGSKLSPDQSEEYYEFLPVRPTPGPVTSPYGMRTRKGITRLHDGIDYAPPAGTPVIAPLPGRVTKTGFEKGGAGNYVTIETIDKTGKKIEQVFMHLISKALVGVGETVKQGEMIGRVGSTGDSTGPHLHWRTKINERSINPTEFLKMQFALPSGVGKPSDYLRSQDTSEQKQQEDFKKQQEDIRKEKIKSSLDDSNQIIDTEKTTIIEESQQKIYDLKVQSIKADEINKSFLEQDIRMQELLTNFQIKELELLGKQHQIESEISILEADKVTLNNEEKNRLSELYKERKKITKEIELANKESQRAISLQQLESNNAREKAVERLRGELEVILEKVVPKKNLSEIEKNLNDTIVSILKERNELNKKLDEAKSLGDQISFDKIIEALKELDKQLPNFLNQNLDSIRESLPTNISPEDLKTYQNDDSARQEAILKTEQYYTQLRLDTENLIATARKNGYTETITKAEELLNLINQTGGQQVKQIRDQGNILTQVATTAKEAFASGLNQLFSDLITGTKSLGDSLKSFASSILKSIADMAIQSASKSVFKWLGLADGGYVSGPGTSRSDSIPARLSNGEFVMSAASVKHWGVGLLDNLNNRKMPNLAFESPFYNGGSNVSKSATIVMNVNTPDANSFRRSETQLGRDAAEQLRRSMQRNG